MTAAITSATPIHVVGVDGSGPAGLPAGLVSLIQSARLLCGGRRQLQLFPNAGEERFTVTADLDALYRRLEQSSDGGIVVLASGDPCFFGIGPLLSERFGRERVVIHPAPSSVSLAFARLGLAWQDAVVLSAHGRPIEGLVAQALHAARLAILTDTEHTPAAVAQTLLAAGMPDCPAFVCERLGESGEHIHETRLTELPGRCFDPLNVLLLLPGQAAERGAFGRGDDAYNSVRGQITKAEVRAVTLAKLEPWRAGVCWDIGAGSGSVAIEAAGLMHSGAVYAVEQDPEQLAVLRANVHRHHAGLVHVMDGSAPAALESLPAPDSVFIGGTGGALAATLRIAADRLRPGGRLVANFALLERLGVWQTFAAGLAWPSEVCQISVARGQALADGTRLAPLGPVFVTRLLNPEQLR